ncbi:adenylate/guanylate cyclase domain-containing protein [Nocardioides bruguierae]|uniref:Adenylate/guanylate cyclase domain-containing protein n=1 Tax=Nocardioides bruguierae TaxID=2945102 RepID=A0A9X2D863_9ACTN|nr:adenylate/guanylate cyclase domain-containing protein [Nocardioides bruguierae]MCM0621072.1 adenylate/guanylate cyclase domain-containing protein [Nocardioides bruguierae]
MGRRERSAAPGAVADAADQHADEHAAQDPGRHPDLTDEPTVDLVLAPPDDRAETTRGLVAALGNVEELLLGGPPHLTRVEVAARAGVPMDVAESLWRSLGFAHADDDQVAFTDADVTALRITAELEALGVLDPGSRTALVRTWGRSFARLAEWQTSLLARVAVSQMDEVQGDPALLLQALADEVLPRVERLQSYAWRRHLAASATRRLASGEEVPEDPASDPILSLAVCFCDIVGFTSTARGLREPELVDFIETFEDACAEAAVDHGGRIVKSIGDEVLLVADTVEEALRIACDLTARGEDEDDPFPRVRVGIAYGEVVARLGDVLGPVVNVAARLTSIARPGAILVDDGAAEVLADAPDVRLKRLHRTTVKGYRKLQPWLVRPPEPPPPAEESPE